MIQFPNLQIPDWDAIQYEERGGGGGGAFSNRFICNDSEMHTSGIDEFDVPVHIFSTDQFRMFEFKVKKCQRGRSHDWTECPYAHPGEKARRRDPNKYQYSGTPCPEFRSKGNCNKGDFCHFAHGVFECWLHPSRYRTQLCKDGTACCRRVCFFAHTIDQLRHSTHASASASPESFVPSTTSVLNSSLLDSPPGNSRYGVVPYDTLSVLELVRSMRNVQLEDLTRGSQMGCVFGSPRGGVLSLTSSTPEGPVMERVESGRDLRAKIYAKLSKENHNGAAFSAPIPDIGWVSELVK